MKTIKTLALAAATVLATHSAAQAYFVTGSKGLMINCPNSVNVTLSLTMGAVQNLNTVTRPPQNPNGPTGPNVTSLPSKRVTYSLVASHSLGADGNIVATPLALATKTMTIHYSNSNPPSNKVVLDAFKTTIANYKSSYDDRLKRVCNKTTVKVIDKTPRVAIPAR